MSDPTYPYNLPIWRRSFEASAPDGSTSAAITQAFETSMSNPTMGTLKLADGLSVNSCNPSFIWSDDSRYLAVPQWRFAIGLQLKQRLLVVDVQEKIVFGSRPLGWWILPLAFERGVLTVNSNPTRSPREHRFQIPSDLNTFRNLRSRSEE